MSITEEAIKKARSEYQREWRKKNPTKTKEYLTRYWQKRIMREQNENSTDHES